MPKPTPAPHDDGAIERAEALHDLVLRSLDDDKAVDVVSIPLAGKSNIADHMVIASGRSTRQVAAMARSSPSGSSATSAAASASRACRSPTGC